jgi:TM2 domain-containing membrane protein YozV
MKRNWYIALWLSLMFGWAGLDSFYLGKPLRGTIKLLTAGLFGILWIVDFLAILMRSVRGVTWK